MRNSVSMSKSESEYKQRVAMLRNQIVTDHPESPQEGFEFFESDEYRLNYGNGRSPIIEKFTSGGLKNIFGMLKIFAKHMPNMSKGRTECFSDLKPYFNGSFAEQHSPLIKSFPNIKIWNDLKTYAWEKWQIKIGFTELPEQLVFKGKAVLFRYAIVCIQEMDKKEIDKAPGLPAGDEVLRIYKELGLAVNDIARWLRKNHQIHCQSNHPLGGLTNTTPLAGKCGLGWQGHNGLLITPWYGQRQRIAPIFIEEKIFEFTDSHEHTWIEEFCKSCRKCEKSCPVNAIYPSKITSINNVPGIGETRTCIDMIKCFPQFNATLGCSICIKVCPFSQGEGSYKKLKDAYDRKKNRVSDSVE